VILKKSKIIVKIIRTKILKNKCFSNFSFKLKEKSFLIKSMILSKKGSINIQNKYKKLVFIGVFLVIYKYKTDKKLKNNVKKMYLERLCNI
jgi:hypothetical protein